MPIEKHELEEPTRSAKNLPHPSAYPKNKIADKLAFVYSTPDGKSASRMTRQTLLGKGSRPDSTTVGGTHSHRLGSAAAFGSSIPQGTNTSPSDTLILPRPSIDSQHLLTEEARMAAATREIVSAVLTMNKMVFGSHGPVNPAAWNNQQSLTPTGTTTRSTGCSTKDWNRSIGTDTENTERTVRSIGTQTQSPDDFAPDSAEPTAGTPVICPGCSLDLSQIMSHPLHKLSGPPDVAITTPGNQRIILAAVTKKAPRETIPRHAAKKPDSWQGAKVTSYGSTEEQDYVEHGEIGNDSEGKADHTSDLSRQCVGPDTAIRTTTNPMRGARSVQAPRRSARLADASNAIRIGSTPLKQEIKQGDMSGERLDTPSGTKHSNGNNKKRKREDIIETGDKKEVKEAQDHGAEKTVTAQPRERSRIVFRINNVRRDREPHLTWDYPGFNRGKRSPE